MGESRLPVVVFRLPQHPWCLNTRTVTVPVFLCLIDNFPPDTFICQSIFVVPTGPTTARLLADSAGIEQLNMRCFMVIYRGTSNRKFTVFKKYIYFYI